MRMPSVPCRGWTQTDSQSVQPVRVQPRLAVRLTEATTGLCAALTPTEKGTGYRCV